MIWFISWMHFQSFICLFLHFLIAVVFFLMSLTFLNEFRIHFEHFIVDDLREYGTPLHCSFLITHSATSCPPYASTPLLPHRPVCAVNNESLRLSNLGGQSILEPKQTKQSSRQLNLLHQNTLFLDWLHLAGSRMFYILG